MINKTTELLFGLVEAVTAGEGWRVWRPTDPPFPERHPFGASCVDGHMKIDMPGATIRSPMCLAPHDFLSEQLQRKGRWRDCGMHVRLWQMLDDDPAKEPTLIPDHFQGSRGQVLLRTLPLPKAGDPKGVLLEVGANIGACTVELLLRTNAKLLAFEPSLANVFFLTRSLRMLAAAHPEVADRVVIFPIGAGDEPLHTRIMIDPANLGNSVVEDAPPPDPPDPRTSDAGTAPGTSPSTRSKRSNARRAAARGQAARARTNSSASTRQMGLTRATRRQERSREQQDPGGGPGVTALSSGAGSVRYLNVSVLPLDHVFPQGFGGVRMIKVDAQGYECKVLQGAHMAARQGKQPRLAAPGLQTVVTEIASRWLHTQCCRPHWLLHLLRNLGRRDVSDLSSWTVPHPRCVSQPAGLQYGPWNVSCLRAGADENTCIARRFNRSLGKAAALQIREIPRLPLNRYYLWEVSIQIRRCRHAHSPNLADRQLLSSKRKLCGRSPTRTAMGV